MPVTGLTLDAASVVNRKGNADVALVEFSDFQCPYCARHAADVLPRVMSDLVDTGRLTYVMVHYPLDAIHPLARGAAEAAECAGHQGRFWEMHDRLFALSPKLEQANLETAASSVGLDSDVFEKCMTGEAAEKVSSDVAEGSRLGVTGTPSFFLGTVGGDGSIELEAKVVGGVSVEEIERQMAALGE